MKSYKYKPSCNCGIAFFSEYVDDVVPIKHTWPRKVENNEVERLILFDYLVNNMDRHDGNVLCKDILKPKLYFIDCSHIMMTNDRRLNKRLNLEEELSESYILNTDVFWEGKDNPYSILLDLLGFNEQVVADEIANFKMVITEDLIGYIKKSMPAEWLIGEIPQRISDMFAIMRKRLEKIDEFAEKIVSERRA